MCDFQIVLAIDGFEYVLADQETLYKTTDIWYLTSSI